MPYIEFTALADLLAFAVACENRGEALGQHRHRDKHRHVRFGADEVYRIGFEDGDWPDWNNSRHYLYGGKIHGTPLPGTASDDLKLNDLLARLPLYERTDQSKPSSLLLAVDRNLTDARDLLHSAWRSIPKEEGATSCFYIRGDDRPGDVWLGVEVRGVAGYFEYASFRKRNPNEALTVFAPAWRDEHCFLYVQWGCAYPKPEEFASLYDTRQSGIRELLTVTAGAPVSLKHSSGVSFRHSKWTRLALPIEPAVESFYELQATPGSQVPPRIIEPRPLSELERLHLPLTIGTDREMIGDAAEIETRLARCGREMEELLSRKARLRNRGFSLCCAVFSFDQKDGTPLPEKLRRFLDQPLGELARYHYFCGSVPEGRRHFLIGAAPITWGAATALPSDDLWLCDARWPEWQLPLYLPVDQTLSAHIQDENVAGKVRELLDNILIPEIGQITSEMIVLAEPEGTEGDFRLIPIQASLRLDEALAFLSSGRSVVTPLAELSEAAHAELELTVGVADAAISEAVTDLDRNLQQRAAELLGELEHAWEETRKQSTEALFRLRVVETAVDIGCRACDESLSQWANYVKKVLHLDKQISRLKIEAAEEWLAKKATREKELKDAAKARRSFAEKIRQSQVALAAASAVFAAERETVEGELENLKSAWETATEEEQRLAQRLDELKARNGEAQTLLAKIRRQELEHDTQIKELQAREQELEKRRRDLADRRSRLEGHLTSIEASTVAVQEAEENDASGVNDLIRAVEAAMEFFPPPSPPPPRSAAARLMTMMGGRE